MRWLRRHAWWGLLAVSVMIMLGVVISFAFASELLRFGEGVIATLGFTLSLVGILVWLLIGNLLAWRGTALPGNLAVLGMAAGITFTLLYPAWALWLTVILRRQASVTPGAS